MSQDLYGRMGSELRALFKSLKQRDEKRIHQQMEQILKTADQIGEPFQSEVGKLQAAMQVFLQRPDDLSLGADLRERVMRLEQETREL